MYKLINQLVFQNICPLYNVNYYWEFIKPNDSNLYLYFLPFSKKNFIPIVSTKKSSKHTNIAIIYL